MEDLEKKIETLKSQEKSLLQKEYEIKEALNEELKTYLTEVLTEEDIMGEGDEIEGGDISFTIKRPHPEVSYKKDIFTIYFEGEVFYSDKEKTMKVNYYTCGSTNDDFEMNRLISLGKLAHLILHKKEEISGVVESIIDRYNVDIKAAKGERYKIGKEINKIKEEINCLKKEQFNEDLKQGIVFEKEIELTNNSFSRRNIKLLKLIDLTPSGKTGTFIVKYTNGFEETLKIRMILVRDLYHESVRYVTLK